MKLFIVLVIVVEAIFALPQLDLPPLSSGPPVAGPPVQIFVPGLQLIDPREVPRPAEIVPAPPPPPSTSAPPPPPTSPPSPPPPPQVVAAAPKSAEEPSQIDYNLNFNEIGEITGYAYNFDTPNGFRKSEYGEIKNTGDSSGPGPAVTGSYAYIGQDGKAYNVEYTAGEGGFRPKFLR